MMNSIVICYGVIGTLQQSILFTIIFFILVGFTFVISKLSDWIKPNSLSNAILNILVSIDFVLFAFIIVYVFLPYVEFVDIRYNNITHVSVFYATTEGFLYGTILRFMAEIVAIFAIIHVAIIIASIIKHQFRKRSGE